MKKLKTVLTAIVLLLTVSVFANDPEIVTPRVKGAFEKDFIKAKDVNWVKKADFYFAWFNLNNFKMNAAYNEAGELLSTSRELSLAQLPLNITLSIAQKYEKYTLPETATELNFNGETYYYLNVYNAKHSLKLKFSTYGDVTIIEKLNKKQ